MTSRMGQKVRGRGGASLPTVYFDTGDPFDPMGAFTSTEVVATESEQTWLVITPAGASRPSLSGSGAILHGIDDAGPFMLESTEAGSIFLYVEIGGIRAQMATMPCRAVWFYPPVPD